MTPVAPGAPPRPYTPAVMAGDTLYLSGNIGTDPKTGIAPEAFADAATQALTNQAALLQAAGLTWADVVKINVYVKDITKYQEFNTIYMDGDSRAASRTHVHCGGGAAGRTGSSRSKALR